MVNEENDCPSNNRVGGGDGLGMMWRWGYFVTKEENIVSWRDTGLFPPQGTFKLSNVVMILS